MPLGSGVMKGIKTMLMVTGRKPATVLYPEQLRDISYRFRGQVGMRRDEVTGGMTCVGCGLCETACPNDVIRVDTSENEDGTRFVDRYLFDVGRCVFCYFCIEACPVDALQRTHREGVAQIMQARSGLARSAPQAELACQPDEGSSQMKRAERPAAGEHEEAVTLAAASEADFPVPAQCLPHACVQGHEPLPAEFRMADPQSVRRDVFKS